MMKAVYHHKGKDHVVICRNQREAKRVSYQFGYEPVIGLEELEKLRGTDKPVVIDIAAVGQLLYNAVLENEESLRCCANCKHYKRYRQLIAPRHHALYVCEISRVYELEEDDPTPVLFAVVADGIGGHRAGEVAAELAVDHISQAIEESDARRPQKILEKAIQEASDAIADHAASKSEKKGMGSTCACVSRYEVR